MRLFGTVPDSEGKAAALARSRLLTEKKYTLKRPVPSYKKGEPITLGAGETVTGVLYSSTEINDKFVTENISFESFLSMVANPDSALYTVCHNGGRDGKIWTFTGIVCNGLVRYAYDIKRRISTKRWLDTPGIRLIARHGEYGVEDIRLCDTLYAFGEGRNHVILVTDILRDGEGVIREIELSEAIRTSATRRRITVEDFSERFKLYHLTRYDFVDSVPPPDEQDVMIMTESGLENNDPILAVDFGNKSNYRTEEPVTVSYFGEEQDTVIIKRGEETVEEISVRGYTKIKRSLPRGYYTVSLAERGQTLELAVTEPTSSYVIDNGEITVTFDSCDPHSSLLYMDFRELREKGVAVSSLSKIIEVTEEERIRGKITRRIPEDAGSYKLYFRNKYGVWTHTMKVFRHL